MCRELSGGLFEAANFISENPPLGLHFCGAAADAYDRRWHFPDVEKRI